MKKILALLIVAGYSGFAQIRYEPGYFIDNSGKKTTCLIRNLAWNNNPVDFDYKLDETAPSRKNFISDVTEFNVGESYKYKRFAVEIDRSGTDLDNLSHARNPEFKKEILFLKVLVEGNAYLYQYEETNMVRFFMSPDGQKTPTQLIFKEYIEAEDTKIGQNNYFRQQLFTTMGTEKFPKSSFEKIDYKQDDLVKIFVAYNDQTGLNTSNFSEKQNKSSFNVKVIAGVGNPRVSYHETEDPDGDVNFEKKTAFLGAIEAELILPFNQNKWSLFVNGGYQDFSLKGIAKDQTQAKLDCKFIDITGGVRHYFFLTAANKIFLDAGVVFAIDVGSALQYGPEIYSGSIGNVRNKPLDVRSGANVFAGLGFSHGRLSAELRYNFKRDIIPEYMIREALYSAAALRFGIRIL